MYQTLWLRGGDKLTGLASVLNENPYLHAWASNELVRALFDFLNRPDVLLFVVVICGGVALGASLKVWADFRRAAPKPSVAPSSKPESLSDVQETIEQASQPRALDPTDFGNSKCRWRKDTIQPFAETTRWICSKCNGFSFTGDGTPPVTCRANDPRQKL